MRAANRPLAVSSVRASLSEWGRAGEPFSVMLGTCYLRDSVGDGLTIHALVDVTQLHRHAGDSSRLLRRGDFGQTKGHNVLGAHTVTLGADSVAHLGCKVLIGLASLGNRLGTRLGELVVHLLEHGHHIRVVGATLHRKSDSVGAGNAILLGSHKATPICPILGLSFLAPVWRGKWHRLDLLRSWDIRLARCPLGFLCSPSLTINIRLLPRLVNPEWQISWRADER